MAPAKSLFAVVLVATSCSKPALQSIDVAPAGYSVEQGVQLQATATGHYSDGTSKDLTATASWSSSSGGVATIDSSQRVFTVGTGTTTLIAASDGKSGSATLTVTPRMSFALPVVGLYVSFEDRGFPNGYYQGDLLHKWNDFDGVVGHTVAAEAELQLDKMQAMGINTITFELRSADPNASPSDPYVPPGCPVNPSLGPDYPQPSSTDLANLNLLLDELHKRGMKMWLRLVNTHMEESPPTNNQTWLRALLQGVMNHPALDLVVFEGAPHTIVNYDGSIICGGQAEPPLWMGPTSTVAAYEQFAIGLAMSLGMPSTKLSAEGVVGNFNIDSETVANPANEFTDGHLWYTPTVLKSIFDALNIPANQRTYALSMYETRKCSNNPQNIPCTEKAPQDWGDETLQRVFATVGSGSRVVATEMGDLSPVTTAWSTDHALEGLDRLFRKYGVAGGSFWRWAGYSNDEDTDPTRGDPVKYRGAAFKYSAVENVLVDAGGWHLPSVQNGSFESGIDHWTSGGSGSITQYDLTQEPGEPEVPWRGTHVLRMTTGAGASDVVTATSDKVSVQPAIVYTTTANLRFVFADSSPTATITLLYYQAAGDPSKARASDSFAFHKSDGPAGFGIFPVQYVPPADAASAAVQFSLARGGSSMPATLDVDDVR